MQNPIILIDNIALRWLLVAAVLALTSCASTPTRNPVPHELANSVEIPGIPEARFWEDEWPKFSIENLNVTDAELKEDYSAIYGKPHNYLAISGGGPHGAFGAGLLNGWSQSGTRPEFTMVTGISTGALTAPFAFLGTKYDEKLKSVYTTISTKDVLKKRWLFSAIFSDAIADTTPLKETIAKHITPDMVEEIASEHRKGRRLFIGTVSLDAGRSVIWNIGAIADSNHPTKVDFIREIMRASAAIPVAFPPVVIPVQVNGQNYDELHVDGGTGSQVFIYPAAIDWKQITETLKVQGRPNVYVLRNSTIEAKYEMLEMKMLPIASRTISSLIRTQGIGDLYEIYALCQRDDNEFNLAFIPSDFSEESKEEFDPEFMGKLFEFGYQLGLEGYSWKKGPPGFEASTLE